jgi:hypothetical protein
MASMREGFDAANRKTFDPGLCRWRARRADLSSEQARIFRRNQPPCTLLKTAIS